MTLGDLPLYPGHFPQATRQPRPPSGAELQVNVARSLRSMKVLLPQLLTRIVGAISLGAESPIFLLNYRMRRHKTYLPPEFQYGKTLAHYWSVGLLQEAGWYGEREIELAKLRMGRSPSLGSFPYLAIVQRPHRLFLPGDLVVYSINNGCADRYPVWSVSSKGFKVSGYYMLFYRWHRGKQSESGMFKPIWRPGDLAPTDDRSCCVPLDHPAAKKYLADLASRETLPHR